MNTGENGKNRELTEDELNQVTAGGSPHSFVETYFWANGDLNYGVRTINAQNAILPQWAQNLLASK